MFEYGIAQEHSHLGKSHDGKPLAVKDLGLWKNGWWQGIEGFLCGLFRKNRMSHFPGTGLEVVKGLTSSS
jgi:hypothetical protein